MKHVCNRTTRKDDNKNYWKILIVAQFEVYIQKALTKSNSHQIKPKQIKITYASLKRRALSSLNKQMQSSKKLLFLKTNTFKVWLKSLKFSFISQEEAIENCRSPVYVMQPQKDGKITAKLKNSIQLCTKMLWRLENCKFFTRRE